jgi:pyrroloquinoline quinone biosynthesis protein D
MSASAESSIPRIAPSFRFQWEPAQDAYVILYPEGMVKLNPSAGEILKRCDGTANVQAIIADLQHAFPGADLAEEVHRFLEIARGNGWIRFQTPA